VLPHFVCYKSYHVTPKTHTYFPIAKAWVHVDLLIGYNKHTFDSGRQLQKLRASYACTTVDSNMLQSEL